MSVNRSTVYSLGISTPGGFEYIRYTTDKTEADKWVSTPTSVENTMNVYGVTGFVPFIISCPNCGNCHQDKEDMVECLTNESQ